MPDARINPGAAACEADMLSTKLPRLVSHFVISGSSVMMMMMIIMKMMMKRRG